MTVGTPHTECVHVFYEEEGTIYVCMYVCMYVCISSYRRQSYGRHAPLSHFFLFLQARQGKMSSSRDDDECLQVTTKALRLLEATAFLPRLVVFDLDYTLWPFYW